MTTVRAALREGAARLAAAGVETPAADARRLMAFALGAAPDRIALVEGEALEPEARRRWERAVAERAARRPVAQIVGERMFWGRAFRVTGDTLDPRPDSECLIAEALAWPWTRVLDLGTGTGCLLLTLLAERPGARGLGVDLSPAALQVARGNAAALGLSGRAEFAEGDWFAPVTGVFDLIVANPPYIAEDEMAELQPEVRDWEPRMALTPGPDGLLPLRKIAEAAAGFLAPGGRLIAEIGMAQGQEALSILSGAGLRDARIVRDLDGRDRAVTAIRS